MSSIPEENWGRAFSPIKFKPKACPISDELADSLILMGHSDLVVLDGGWVEEQIDNQEAKEKKPEINPLDHEQTH